MNKITNILFLCLSITFSFAQIVLAQGGASTPENTDGVNNNGEVTEYIATGVRVDFENTPSSKYAFDSPQKAVMEDYQKVDENGNKLVKVTIKDKEVPVFVGTEEALNKLDDTALPKEIGQKFESLDDLAQKLKGVDGWSDNLINELKQTFKATPTIENAKS